MSIFVNDVHPENALLSIISTPFGIAIILIFLQFLNVDCSIFLILLEIEMSLIDVQSEKHSSPIYVVVSGIIIFFNDKHPLNDLDPIFDMDNGILISLSDVQFSKRLSLISLIEFGMMIFVIDEHPVKHPFPMDVVLFGILILTNDLQFLNE